MFSSWVAPRIDEPRINALIGGLSNTHNACCNVCQAQDPLGRDGKTLIPDLVHEAALKGDALHTKL